MNMFDFYCSVWNDDTESVEKGPHGKLETVIVNDAYFIASDISRNMPDNQRVDELDMEGVEFTVDVSGDTITEDDVTSSAKRYLEKFPNVYTGVAKYVENLDHVPVDRLSCPHCGNTVAANVQ